MYVAMYDWSVHNMKEKRKEKGSLLRGNSMTLKTNFHPTPPTSVENERCTIARDRGDVVRGAA